MLLRPTYGVSDALNEKVVLRVPPLSSFLRLEHSSGCKRDIQYLSWLLANPERAQRGHLPQVTVQLSWTLSPVAYPHPPAMDAQVPRPPAPETFEEQ